MAVRPRARRAMDAGRAAYDAGSRRVHALLDDLPGARRTIHELGRVEAVNRAVILASQILLSLVPMLIVMGSFLPHGVSQGLAVRVQVVVGISGSGATSIRSVLAAPPQQVRTQAGVLGLLLAVASAVSFAQALQAMYHRVWEQERPRGIAATRSCAVWLIVWISYLLLGAVAAHTLGRGGAWTPGRVPLLILFGTLLWVWTPHTLLLGRVPWSQLWVGALLTGIGTTLLSEGSRVVMPRFIASEVAEYGPLGLVFALASWLIVLASIVVGSAVVGRVIAEEPAVGAYIGQLTRVLGRPGRRGRRGRPGPPAPGPPDQPAPPGPPERSGGDT